MLLHCSVPSVLRRVFVTKYIVDLFVIRGIVLCVGRCILKKSRWLAKGFDIYNLKNQAPFFSYIWLILLKRFFNSPSSQRDSMIASCLNLPVKMKSNIQLFIKIFWYLCRSVKKREVWLASSTEIQNYVESAS